VVAVIAGALIGAVAVAGVIVPAADPLFSSSRRGGPPPAAAAAAAPVTSPTAGASAIASTSPASRPADEPTSSATEIARSTPVQPIEIKVPAHGPGTYKRAKLKLAAAKGSGRVISFDVRVERGLALDPNAVAREIHATLSDKRSWRGSEHVRFRLVSDPANARLHAYVVTPGTTDRLCYPWRTRGAVSCQNGNRVVLNARRWVFGAKAYEADVARYRQYLVNHEFGHSLGYNHVGCPGKGRPAPVMMQQTKGLKGCRANPWPAVAR
jgi:hypothetical protein